MNKLLRPHKRRVAAVGLCEGTSGLGVESQTADSRLSAARREGCVLCLSLYSCTVYSSRERVVVGVERSILTPCRSPPSEAGVCSSSFVRTTWLKLVMAGRHLSKHPHSITNHVRFHRVRGRSHPTVGKGAWEGGGRTVGTWKWEAYNSEVQLDLVPKLPPRTRFKVTFREVVF